MKVQPKTCVILKMTKMVKYQVSFIVFQDAYFVSMRFYRIHIKYWILNAYNCIFGWLIILDEILTPYLICAGFIGGVTLYMFFLYFQNVISKISTSHEDTIDNRKYSNRNSDTDLIILMVWVWSIYIWSKWDDGFTAVGSESLEYNMQLHMWFNHTTRRNILSNWT